MKKRVAERIAATVAAGEVEKAKAVLTEPACCRYCKVRVWDVHLDDALAEGWLLGKHLTVAIPGAAVSVSDTGIPVNCLVCGQGDVFFRSPRGGIKFWNPEKGEVPGGRMDRGLRVRGIRRSPVLSGGVLKQAVLARNAARDGKQGAKGVPGSSSGRSEPGSTCELPPVTP